MTHELKTLPAYWDAVERGDKTFEVRRDDRGFQKGDVLELQRLYPDSRNDVELSLRGKPKFVIRAEVKYILTGGQFGIEPGPAARHPAGWQSGVLV